MRTIATEVAAGALTFFLPFNKVEDLGDGSVYVEGIATAEILDAHGEIVDHEASKAAFAEWTDAFQKATDGKSLGNIREMHGPVAAGKAVMWYPDDEAKANIVGAKIVDAEAAKKCRERVYTGFSIGAPGHSVKREANHITAYQLGELSVVDAPACPNATFSIVKRAEVAPDPLPVPQDPPDPEIPPGPGVQKDAVAAVDQANLAIAAMKELAIELLKLPGEPATWTLEDIINGIRMAISGKIAAEQAAAEAGQDPLGAGPDNPTSSTVAELANAAPAADLKKIHEDLIKAQADVTAQAEELKKLRDESAQAVEKAVALKVEEATAPLRAANEELRKKVDGLPAPVGRPVVKKLGSVEGEESADTTKAVEIAETAIKAAEAAGASPQVIQKLRIDLASEAIKASR